MTANTTEKIAVLDFGGQYAHLIAKRVRDLGAHSEILLPDAASAKLKTYKGIILSGGPAFVFAADAPPYNPDLFSLGIPVLGVCYGHQLMAYTNGGEAQKGERREDGFAQLQIKDSSSLLQGWNETETVWMSHGSEVNKLPPGFTILASTENCPIAVMGDLSRKLYGIQFHAEVTHTPKGIQLYDNFLNICGIARTWKISNLIPQILENIRTQVQDRNVFLLVSGGIDSTVAFMLLNQALGKERVYGLHVDTGFMRQDESHKVQTALRQIGMDNFHIVDASIQFLQAVNRLIDPEQKRRAIGKVFLDVQTSETSRMKLDPAKWMLGQGTLYPDTIESGGTKHADTIKTHHNRVPEIQAMIDQGLVVEPVANLYKDEVRKIGEELGLPEELVWRHTFPGPGLAVQEICATAAEPVADYDQLKQNLNKLTSAQGYSADILPIRSVGVQGDERSYAHPAVVMGEQNWTKLADLATRITNQFRAINRVIFLVQPEQLASSKLQQIKPTTITRQSLNLHRQADDVANQILLKHDLYRTLYEFPVVMIPISPAGGQSIVLRPLYSENVMTVEFAKLPWPVVQQMATAILALPGIDAVFYDITNKPPGTVQWE